MFNDISAGTRRVCDMNTREKERIMHTGDNLSGVPWLINSYEELEPGTEEPPYPFPVPHKKNNL